MDKDKALEVGERFLNACFSAWSCGEPSHRVRTMLDLADEFRAALDDLEEANSARLSDDELLRELMG